MEIDCSSTGSTRARVTADRVKVRLYVLIVRERQPAVPDLDRASLEELRAFAARHEHGRCWQELFSGAGRMRGEYAAADLVAYAEARARALAARGQEDFRRAVKGEEDCARIKERLPQWARWG